jgi:hypothetical protein
LLASLQARVFLSSLAEFAVHYIDGHADLAWDLLHVSPCHFQLGMAELSLDVPRLAVFLEVCGASSTKR